MDAKKRESLDNGDYSKFASLDKTNQFRQNNNQLISIDSLDVSRYQNSNHGSTSNILGASMKDLNKGVPQSTQSNISILGGTPSPKFTTMAGAINSQEAT